MRPKPSHLRVEAIEERALPAPITLPVADPNPPGHFSSQSTGPANNPTDIDFSPGQSGSTPGQAGSSPGQSGSTPGQSGSNPGLAGTAPGQSDSTPGQSGSVPGQSGTAPGLSGTPPGHAGSTPGYSGTAPGQSGLTPGQAGSTPGKSGTAPGQSDLTPGQAVTAPGSSGTSPGQAGTTPGQAGSTPGKSSEGPGQSASAPGQSGSAPGLAGDTPGQSGSTGGSGGTPGSSGNNGLALGNQGGTMGHGHISNGSVIASSGLGTSFLGTAALNSLSGNSTSSSDSATFRVSTDLGQRTDFDAAAHLVSSPHKFTISWQHGGLTENPSESSLNHEVGPATSGDQSDGGRGQQELRVYENIAQVEIEASLDRDGDRPIRPNKAVRTPNEILGSEVILSDGVELVGPAFSAESDKANSGNGSGRSLLASTIIVDLPYIEELLNATIFGPVALGVPHFGSLLFDLQGMNVWSDELLALIGIDIPESEDVDVYAWILAAGILSGWGAATAMYRKRRRRPEVDRLLGVESMMIKWYERVNRGK